jgi:hypothetical protein
MNKETAVESMATFVHQNNLNKIKDGSKQSYIETCTDLYDYMDSEGLIVKD